MSQFVESLLLTKLLCSMLSLGRMVRCTHVFLNHRVKLIPTIPIDSVAKCE